MVQWLRLRAPTAGGAGSIPGRGIKTPHASHFPFLSLSLSPSVKWVCVQRGFHEPCIPSAELSPWSRSSSPHLHLPPGASPGRHQLQGVWRERGEGVVCATSAEPAHPPRPPQHRGAGGAPAGLCPPSPLLGAQSSAA